MNEDQLDVSAPDLPSGRFAGRVAFEQLVRDALAGADARGWSELILCDANFSDWPIGERSVVESLQTWAKTGRRLTLIAHSYDAVLRQKPRFVSWRQTWDHIVTCRQCRAVDAADFPSALWSPQWCLQRTDPARSQGIGSSEPQRRLQLHQLLLEYSRNSAAGFPASVIGL